MLCLIFIQDFPLKAASFKSLLLNKTTYKRVNFLKAFLSTYLVLWD